MPEYTCATCGAEVKLLPDGTLQRTCDHSGTIHWNMSAVVYGQGDMPKAEMNPVFELFRKLGQYVLEVARGIRPR